MRDLMVCSGPMKVLDFLMEDLNHKNPKMREDILIYMIYALLTFPRYAKQGLPPQNLGHFPMLS